MSDPFTGMSKARPASVSGHTALATGANALTTTADAFYCNADGTITITDDRSVSLSYDCVKGQFLPFRSENVNVVSGTFMAWYF